MYRIIGSALRGIGRHVQKFWFFLKWFYHIMIQMHQISFRQVPVFVPFSRPRFFPILYLSFNIVLWDFPTCQVFMFSHFYILSHLSSLQQCMFCTFCMFCLFCMFCTQYWGVRWGLPGNRGLPSHIGLQHFCSQETKEMWFFWKLLRCCGIERIHPLMTFCLSSWPATVTSV